MTTRSPTGFSPTPATPEGEPQGSESEPSSGSHKPAPPKKANVAPVLVSAVEADPFDATMRYREEEVATPTAGETHFGKDESDEDEEGPDEGRVEAEAAAAKAELEALWAKAKELEAVAARTPTRASRKRLTPASDVAGVKIEIVKDKKENDEPLIGKELLGKFSEAFDGCSRRANYYGLVDVKENQTQHLA